jgi:hypothetical protein
LDSDLIRFQFDRAIIWMKIHAPALAGEVRRRVVAVQRALSRAATEDLDRLVVTMADTAFFIAKAGKELQPIMASVEYLSSSDRKTRKPRGRKKADYPTEQREADVVADWKRAKARGVSKADFANDNKDRFAKGGDPNVKQFNRLLNRVAHRELRKRRADN